MSNMLNFEKSKKECNEVSLGNSQNGDKLQEVVELNVGGSFFTTSLSTLRRSPHSMLAAMFSGRHSCAGDHKGRENCMSKKAVLSRILKTIGLKKRKKTHQASHVRFFIDRDGAAFKHVLAFLREGVLPPLDASLGAYREAQFYNVEEMCAALECLRPVAGERLRKEFLAHVPDYDSNLLLLLEKAQQVASSQPERVTKLRVCVFKEEIPPTSHPLHKCDVNVTFGPWKATPDVYDLIDCIRHDLSTRGYELEQQCIGVCDQELGGQHFCKRPIFEFKLKWW